LVLDRGKRLASRSSRFIPAEGPPVPTGQEAAERVWSWWQRELYWIQRHTQLSRHNTPYISWVISEYWETGGGYV